MVRRDRIKCESIPASIDDVESHQSELLRQGIAFHYDRSDRLISQRNRRIDPAAKTKIRSYKYGLFTAVLAVLIAFLVVFLLPKDRFIRGDAFDLKLSFQKIEGLSDLEIKLKLIPKKNEVVVQKEDRLIYTFWQNEQVLYQSQVIFPKQMVFQEGYPLVELIQVPKDIFIRSTEIEIDFRKYGLSKKLKL